RRVAALEIAHEAVEHRRRHGRIAERGQPVAHRSDVMIDAENLLHHHHAAFDGALRVGAVSAELMLVAGGERELLAQSKPPFRYCKRTLLSTEIISSSFRGARAAG